MTKSDNQGNKTGVHRVGNEKYHAGDVIESDQPLDVLFRNKFERVPDSTKVSEPEIVRTVRTPNIPNPVKEKEVDEVDSSDKNEESTSTSNPTSKKENTYGKDVTADYPAASTLGLKVFHSAKYKIFTIVDDEDGEFVVKTSKSKKNISRFLEKQVG